MKKLENKAHNHVQKHRQYTRTPRPETRRIIRTASLLVRLTYCLPLLMIALLVKPLTGYSFEQQSSLVLASLKGYQEKPMKGRPAPSLSPASFRNHDYRILSPSQGGSKVCEHYLAPIKSVPRKNGAGKNDHDVKRPIMAGQDTLPVAMGLVVGLRLSVNPTAKSRPSQINAAAQVRLFDTDIGQRTPALAIAAYRNCRKKEMLALHNKNKEPRPTKP